MQYPAELLEGVIPSSADSKSQGHGSFAATSFPVMARDDRAVFRHLERGANIVAAGPGDHPLILKLLIQTQYANLAEDFSSRLDEPGYQACDRLLIRAADQLLGHVQVTKRITQVGDQRIACGRFQDFVVLPEYRAARFDDHLLEVAETTARSEGVLFGITQTLEPEWFAQRGWSRVRDQGFTRAPVCAVLSQFDTKPARIGPRSGPSLEVRTWRHYQLDQIEHLYNLLCPLIWGAHERSTSLWQWVVGRRGHDQILMAVDNSRTAEDAASKRGRVVGYGIVRDSSIVELFTLPNYPQAAKLILARACRDAVEQGYREISLHVPVKSPEHELLMLAGGSWVTDPVTCGGQLMIKLFDPAAWCQRIYSLLRDRAKQANLNVPLSVDFDVNGQGYRFTLTRRSAKLENLETSTGTQLCCDPRTFQNLLLGNLDLRLAVEKGQLRFGGGQTEKIVEALFPAQQFWQSSLEYLRL